MKMEGLLQYSQKPSTNTYAEPDQSIQYHLVLSLYEPF
jgi:hypothetical protein